MPSDSLNKGNILLFLILKKWNFEQIFIYRNILVYNIKCKEFGVELFLKSFL